MHKNIMIITCKYTVKKETWFIWITKKILSNNIFINLLYFS